MMEEVIQYAKENRQVIIDAKTTEGKRLKAELNHINGDFLVFTDDTGENLLEKSVKDLEKRVEKLEELQIVK